MFKTEELLRAIDAARTVATGGPERRVVRLDVDRRGTLQLSANAGDTHVSASATGIAAGDTHTAGVVPEQLRLGVVAMRRDEMDVAVDAGAVTLTAGARRIVVNTVEIQHSPVMPIRPDKHDVDLTASDIATRLPLAAAASSRESDRPALPGVSLWVHQGTLRLVGTDGHRLHVITTSASVVDALDGPLAWLPKAVVARLGDHAGAGARIYAPFGAMSRHWLEAEGVTWSWVSPCPYPTWTMILPSSDAVTTVVGVDGLAEYMRAAAKTLDGWAGKGVRLARAEGLLRASMPWSHEIFTEESWPSTGDDFALRINPAYMADAMAAAGDNPVVEFREELSPVVVRGDAGFSVAMPMKP